MFSLGRGRDKLSQCITEEPLNFLSLGELSILASMRIFITTETGPTIVLEVKPSDTIFRVKVKVEEQVHISPITQRLDLFLADEPLEDARTLEHYNIQHGTALELRRCGMQIFINDLSIPGKKLFSFQVTPRHTIGDVKKMIESRSRLTIRNIRLLRGRAELWNDDLTLEEYKIETGTTLFFACRLLPIRENGPGMHAH